MWFQWWGGNVKNNNEAAHDAGACKSSNGCFVLRPRRAGMNPELLHVDKSAGKFVRLYYSCRSASIGSILAARRAGKYPNTIPIAAEKISDRKLMNGSKT
jgi:hypothetical protein